MHACLLHIAVNGISYGTEIKHMVVCRVKVTELLTHSAEHIDSGVHIHTALVFGKNFSKLDKSASRTSTSGRVVKHGFFGSAEVNAGKPIVTAVSDKVVCNLLCRIKILNLTRVNVRDYEAVKRPSLTARPRRADSRTLTAEGSNGLTRLAVVLYDMNYGAVLAEPYLRVP